MSARSCDQLCPITADRMRAGNLHPSEGTCTLIIRALMISVAPAVPLVSVHECQLSVLISATCHQCHISVPI
ncbi:unnamed protein product [Staurois parvus]|uniref:Uncharacterized protein n=1 Tax=Staurois parvus TaxID=386267 RepID=A0ABN9AZ03_9NEOB|nr:unnamed protein product [Staurois parvus]